MPEYEKIEYANKGEQLQKYWNNAIGLQAVDNLKPSDYLYKLSEENIKGDISIKDVQNQIHSYYQKTDIKSDDRTKECDIVSTRIVELLEIGNISLNPSALKSIHGFLFKDIYDFAGQFRDYNISKSEPILGGDSVHYANFFEIENILNYDFDRKKNIKYASMSKKDVIERLSEFTSSIWQVHPFGEGNTRTTAVFIELYLNNLGFEVDNELFKEHSLYFRNSLVKSNYADYKKGIDVDFSYLLKFFENLLYGVNNILDM